MPTQSVKVVRVPWTRVLIDVCLLMCVGFPILFLYLWGSPFQRGFYCDDDSIRYPFFPSTVPSKYLYAFGLLLPTVVIILVEYFNRSKRSTETRFAGVLIPSWLVDMYCIMGVFLFGMACCQLTTDIFKYMVGRLRPHFIQLCDPSVNCTAVVLSGRHTYITNYTCMNPHFEGKDWRLRDMRLSFPSGHSSFSIYAMTFFSIYLEKRMTWRGSALLKHALQYLGLMIAFFICLTRISDYKHHWSDVLSGSILGLVVGLLAAAWFIEIFKNRKENIIPDEMHTLNGNRSTSQPHHSPEHIPQAQVQVPQAQMHVPQAQMHRTQK